MDLPNVLRYVDVFLPNEVEALHLSGQKTLSAALEKLAKLGNIIVVKLGEKGSVSKQGESTFEADAFLNKNIVDAIGAGDSFNAGFIAKFVKGKSVKECQIFGNLMGAINTTQPGGTTAFTNFVDIMTVAKERFGYTALSL